MSLDEFLSTPLTARVEELARENKALERRLRRLVKILVQKKLIDQDDVARVLSNEE